MDFGENYGVRLFGASDWVLNERWILRLDRGRGSRSAALAVCFLTNICMHSSCLEVWCVRVLLDHDPNSWTLDLVLFMNGSVY